MLITHLCFQLLRCSVAWSQGCFTFLSFFYCPTKGRGGKELVVDRIRTADLNWPKIYSKPYDIIQKASSGNGGRSLFLLLHRVWLGISQQVARIGCASPAIYNHMYISIAMTSILFFLPYQSK